MKRASVQKVLPRQVARPRVKPRFGRNEVVSGAVAQRSGARLAALGGSVAGVNGANGYTGHEARLIRNARADQKAKISIPSKPVNTAPRPIDPRDPATNVRRDQQNKSTLNDVIRRVDEGERRDRRMKAGARVYRQRSGRHVPNRPRY